MNLRTDDPVIPLEIQQKIKSLNQSIEDASNLYCEIYDWYDTELKSYCPTSSADMELFNPNTGISVSQLSELALLESLSELQTGNEVEEAALSGI